jgi:hypothetical protein
MSPGLPCKLIINNLIDAVAEKIAVLFRSMQDAQAEKNISLPAI